MMNKEDVKGFFAKETDLDWENFVIETYWFETNADPDLAAASLCSEHSTAQWKRPGIKEDLRLRYGAKVLNLEILEVSRQPAYASPFHRGEQFTRCRVHIAHPFINFGAKIPNLLTAVCGEGAFHAPYITAIKLLDLSFPPSYLSSFSGPQFGVQGIKQMINAQDRPVFFGVVKPNIGLAPADFADIAYQAWEGGLDVAKDDEMLGDMSYSPLKERAALMNVKRLEAQQKTGRPKIYLANINDEVDRLIDLHDIAVENGAGAVMVNSMTVGLSAIRMLRKHANVPIVGHFDFIAPFSRLPFFGISSAVITKLQRLSGCDCVIMPGFGERMMTHDEEVKSNVSECVAELGGMRQTLPVPGGSDWAGTLPGVYEKLRTINFGFIMGRGVFGHPMGPKAGAKSVIQAWEAVASHIPLGDYARDHAELKEALRFFGREKTESAQSSELSGGVAENIFVPDKTVTN